MVLYLVCCLCCGCIDVRWNNIGLLGGRSFLEALQQNRTLTHLEMAGNNIPSDTLKALGMLFVCVSVCLSVIQSV